MKVTIRDIAKKANVSVATVSRCINNKGYVHEETRKLIDNVVREMGYAPNQLARLLLKRQSGIIGVIIPHTIAPFYAELIDGIEYEAMSNGYKIMLCITNNNSDRELDYIKVFEDYAIDGAIVCSNFYNVDKIMALNIPLISIDHILDPSIPSITTDNIGGGEIAAKEFAKLGCKNILLLRGPSFLITTSERTLGFDRCAKEFGINYDYYDFDLVNPDQNFIYNIIANHSDYDGIFTLSDSLGIIASGMVRKAGKKIGKDIPLISFDGLNISKWTYPKLTTITQPVNYMGVEAVSTLIKLINGEELRDFHRITQVELNKRDSTKRK